MRTFARSIAAAAALLVSVGITLSAQAADFVKYKGLDGDALDAHHEQRIEIVAWSAGTPTAPVAPAGTTRSKDDAAVSDIAKGHCREAGNAELAMQCAALQKRRFTLHKRSSEPHYPLGRIKR